MEIVIRLTEDEKKLIQWALEAEIKIIDATIITTQTAKRRPSVSLIQHANDLKKVLKKVTTA